MYNIDKEEKYPNNITFNKNTGNSIAWANTILFLLAKVSKSIIYNLLFMSCS